MDGQDNLSGSLQSMVVNGNQTNQKLGSLIQAITSIFPFSSTVGTFTLAAAATTVVPNTFVKANSVIIPFPTNAAAGTLQGSAKSLYISATTAGVSFTVATASAANAAGTETFAFLILNAT